MFGQKEDSVSQIETIVGPSVFLKGKLKSDSTIKIQGKISGEVRAKGDVLVDAGADVKASIQANNIIISGEVSGDLDAQGEIEIAETGKVNGNISSKTLVIRMGASFIGKSIMKEEQERVRRHKLEEVEPEPEIEMTA